MEKKKIVKSIELGNAHFWHAQTVRETREGYTAEANDIVIYYFIFFHCFVFVLQMSSLVNHALINQ